MSLVKNRHGMGDACAETAGRARPRIPTFLLVTGRRIYCNTDAMMAHGAATLASWFLGDIFMVNFRILTGRGFWSFPLNIDEKKAFYSW